MTDFLSRTVSNADGLTAEFDLTFPYLQRANVKVALDGELYSGGFTFLTSSTIELADTPAAGVVVTRYRETQLSELLATFQGKSTFNSAEADLITLQLLYLLQEATDLGLSPTVRVPQFVSFMVTENFAINEICGPFVAPFAMQLPESLAGSVFKAVDNPGAPHVFSIRKNEVTEIGTLSIATNGAVTVSFPASTSFVTGDRVSLVTTTDGGLTNFGATLKFLV